MFFVWSVLYALWNSYINIGVINFEFAKNVIINTFNGHYHLWYIWMTVGMYSIAPFIKKITDNSSQKELLYYVLLAYIFLLLKFLVCFYPFDNFASLALDIRLDFVSGFLIYFVGGCFLSRIEKSNKITAFMIFVGILSLVGDMAFVIFNIKWDGNSYFSPFSIGTSFSLYWLFSQYTENFSKKYSRILIFISRMTLPIYMMHDFGIILIKKVFSFENYGVGITVLISALTFALCFWVSYLLSLNKVTKKLFVGK